MMEKCGVPPLPYSELSRSSGGDASAPPTPLHSAGEHTHHLPPISRCRCFFTLLCAILAAAAILSLSIALAVRARARQSPPLSAAPSSAASFLSAACNSTMYPDLCYQWLQSSPSDDPVAIATSSVRLALSFVQNYTSELSSIANRTSKAAKDCLELMDLATDQLNDSIDGLRSLPLLQIKSAISEVLVKLSGAIAYDLACSQSLAEEFNGTAELERQLQENANVSRSVAIALGIVKRLGVDLSGVAQHGRRRRLLGVSSRISHNDDDDDDDGEAYPEWISEEDRRVLQSSSSSSGTGGGNGSAVVVVAADGGGDYKTIAEAVAAVPSKRAGRFTILIKKGVYEEKVLIPKSMKNLTLIGDGIGATVITGGQSNAGGFTTYNSATVAISGTGFIARRITFRNTAGAAGHQAVALRCNADQAVFDTCSFEGYQDTLYALANRQFYTGCTISGTIDFIFGNAIAVFQSCSILARRPLDNQKNTLTAHGRKSADDPSGFSFHLCTVDADADLTTSAAGIPTFFGRPWQAYSRTVWMQCTISSVIDAAGWLAWDATNAFATTVYYGEYSNSGAGSATDGRVKWPGVHPAISQAEASGFTVQQFIQGYNWLSNAEVKFQAALS